MISIEPFLQYGVLGIIGYMYIKNSAKQSENQNAQFTKLINDLMEDRKETLHNFQTSLNNIMQVMIKQNNDFSTLFLEVNNKIDKVISDKRNLLEFFATFENLINERNKELMSLLADIKLQTSLISINCPAGNESLINKLLRKGIIAEEQILEVTNNEKK